MLVVTGATVLSLLLALHCLSCESFWLDEGQSWGYARRSGSGLLRAIRVDPSMPLYYLTLHFWLFLGESEAFIRSLSAIFAAASIPLIYLVAMKLFDARTAVIAALLLSINQFAIQFAQEARGYAMTMFLVLLATYFAINAVERREWRSWVAYALIAVLSVFSHAFGLYVVGAHMVVLLVARGAGIALKHVLAIGALVAALAFSLLAGPLGDVMRSNRFAWIPRTTATSAVAHLESLTGQSSGWYAVPYFALVCIGFVVIFRAIFCGERASRWKPMIPVAWLLVPILGSLAASLVAPMFYSRYLIVALPPLILVTAVGLNSLRRALPIALALGALLLIGTQVVNTYYDTPYKEQWRNATRAVTVASEPADEILLFGATGAAPYSYYLEVHGAAGPHMLYPIYDPAIQEFRRPPIEDAIADALEVETRLWFMSNHADLVSRFSSIDRDIRAALATRFDVLSDMRYRGVRVTLYVPR